MWRCFNHICLDFANKLISECLENKDISIYNNVWTEQTRINVWVLDHLCTVNWSQNLLIAPQWLAAVKIIKNVLHMRCELNLKIKKNFYSTQKGRSVIFNHLQQKNKVYSELNVHAVFLSRWSIPLNSQWPCIKTLFVPVTAIQFHEKKLTSVNISTRF